MGNKVCIVGLGGVGGYIGGILASLQDNIYFYARGGRLNSILKSGITINSDHFGEVKALPKFASSNAADFEIMDYIILSVKHYSLNQVLSEISPMIDERTVIIPLLNGVENAAKIKSILNKNCTVIDGVIYITSSALRDFSIHHVSPYCDIYIGVSDKNQADKAKLSSVCNLLQSKYITCTAKDDIDAAIWEKYILNCAYNIVTAYYNATTKNVKNNKAALADYKELLDEACMVARAVKINIPSDLEQRHFNHLLFHQSENGTSSLKRDFEAKKSQTELEVFSGELLKIASDNCITLPRTKFFYDELKKRIP